MAIVGYARVSTSGQKLGVQLEKLNQFGCDKIYKEKNSGTNGNRPELIKLLDFVRKGDTVVSTRLDRLARNVLHLNEIRVLFENKEVDLVLIEQNINTKTSTGKLLFQLLATISEFETDLRRERQLEGINKAKRDGVKFGRTSKLTKDQIKTLQAERKSGERVKVLALKYNISIPSVYRLAKTNI